MSNVDIGPKKTMFILVIVVGCFAVLWPKIFYPMLVGNTQNHITPNYLDKSSGCCDVIWENDVNAIKIMIDLCGNILQKNNEADINIRLAFETRRLTKDIVEKCRKEVLAKCNVDIAEFLSENVKLGRNYRQILFELRSTNSSLCLKYNFGVLPEELGIPHRVMIDSQPSVRQERPSHFRPEMLHPALRERGRAIPQYTSSQVSSPPPRIVEGRPGPIPGMRPTIGGAGHVVPPPKTSTSTMGIIMPIYTIGIVIFFTYTLMKIMFKKQDSNNLIYPRVEPDPMFRKRVFNEDCSASSEKVRLANRLTKDDVSSKLVVTALSDMLAEVDQRREALARQRDEAMQQKAATEAKVAEESQKILETSNISNDTVHINGNVLHVNGNVTKSTKSSDKVEEKTTIKVLGMEVTESCEGGKKWSRPSTPIIPPLQLNPPASPPPPATILLEKTVPAESQLLVSHADLKEEIFINDGDEEDVSTEEPAIMLSGKVTLSVIPSEIFPQEEAVSLKAKTEIDIKENDLYITETNNSSIEQLKETLEETDNKILEDELEDSKYTTVSAATEAVAGDSDEDDEEKICEDILLDKNDYEGKTTEIIPENAKDSIENKKDENIEKSDQKFESIDKLQNNKCDINEEIDEEYEVEYEEEVEEDDENIDDQIVETENKNESKLNITSLENKSENLVGSKEKVADDEVEVEEYEIEYEIDEEEEEEEEEKVPEQEKNLEIEKNQPSLSNDKVAKTKENLENDEEEIIEEYELEIEGDEEEEDEQQQNKNEITEQQLEAKKKN